MKFGLVTGSTPATRTSLRSELRPGRPDSIFQFHFLFDASGQKRDNNFSHESKTLVCVVVPRADARRGNFSFPREPREGCCVDRPAGGAAGKPAVGGRAGGTEKFQRRSAGGGNFPAPQAERNSHEQARRVAARRRPVA